MKIATTRAAARAFCRKAGHPLILVPTMGALHQGHAALMKRGRRLAGEKGTLVVSIFVNPSQFGPREDFSKYPRPWKLDLAICRASGVDMVFAPSVEEIYPEDPSVYIDESVLSRGLCGASRPGHFRGVCSVVARLFLILEPDRAVFGEKDWQQLAIIRRMVRDLHFPVRIDGYPTVRELDGLAVSSRNAYLQPEQRALAPLIQTALGHAVHGTTPAAILRTGRRLLAKIPGARLDYLELVDAETLEPARNLRRPMRLAVAVFLGGTRLIDNVAVPRSA